MSRNRPKRGVLAKEIDVDTRFNTLNESKSAETTDDSFVYLPVINVSILSMSRNRPKLYYNHDVNTVQFCFNTLNESKSAETATINARISEIEEFQYSQ